MHFEYSCLRLSVPSGLNVVSEIKCQLMLPCQIKVKIDIISIITAPADYFPIEKLNRKSQQRDLLRQEEFTQWYLHFRKVRPSSNLFAVEWCKQMQYNVKCAHACLSARCQHFGRPLTAAGFVVSGAYGIRMRYGCILHINKTVLRHPYQAVRIPAGPGLPASPSSGHIPPSKSLHREGLSRHRNPHRGEPDNKSCRRQHIFWFRYRYAALQVRYL